MYRQLLCIVQLMQSGFCLAQTVKIRETYFKGALLSFRKEMMRTVAPNVKDQALHPVLCAMEASFQCWRTDLKSPTELCDVLRVMRMACSPARLVSHDYLCSVASLLCSLFVSEKESFKRTSCVPPLCTPLMMMDTLWGLSCLVLSVSQDNIHKYFWNFTPLMMGKFC